MTDEKKTHWKMLINPDYLGAYALPNGEDITVTIESVSREVVTTTGGKKEECTVAKIKGNKPLIINSTNSKSIHKLYGPYIEDWAGKKITLYASTTKFAGEMVECLRIRPDVAKAKREAITDDRLKKAIEAIQGGTYTIERLHESFKLTSDQLMTLKDSLESSNASD